MPREPTKAQLSSRLQFQQQVPAFIQKLRNQVNGVVDPEQDEDDEFDAWQAGSGRPPIPQRPRDERERPPIPQRPDDEPGSADEDDGDEAPQIVVLKEGKHLSAFEAENERRKAKGLQPLSDPSTSLNDASDSKDDSQKQGDKAKGKQPEKPSLSFSSAPGKASKKRKAIVTSDDLDEAVAAATAGKEKQKAPSAKKKAKKGPQAKKGGLLSFGDGEDG